MKNLLNKKIKKIGKLFVHMLYYYTDDINDIRDNGRYVDTHLKSHKLQLKNLLNKKFKISRKIVCAYVGESYYMNSFINDIKDNVRNDDPHFIFYTAPHKRTTLPFSN